MIIHIKYENTFTCHQSIVRYVLDRLKPINFLLESRYIMNVPNFINFIYVIRFNPPLSSVEHDWASLIAKKNRQGAQ